MRLECPIGYTWDTCYLINEIIHTSSEGEHPFEFDVLNQSVFYQPVRGTTPSPSPLQYEEEMYC